MKSPAPIRPWVRQANPPEEKRGVTRRGTGDPSWEIGIRYFYEAEYIHSLTV